MAHCLIAQSVNGNTTAQNRFSDRSASDPCPRRSICVRRCVQHLIRYVKITPPQATRPNLRLSPFSAARPRRRGHPLSVRKQTMKMLRVISALEWCCDEEF
jgi:hypothetical protein